MQIISLDLHCSTSLSLHRDFLDFDVDDTYDHLAASPHLAAGQAVLVRVKSRTLPKATGVSIFPDYPINSIIKVSCHCYAGRLPCSMRDDGSGS